MGKYLAILLTFTLLTMQTVTLAHATAYGDKQHEHNGVECMIAKAGDRHDDDIACPPVIEITVLRHYEAATYSFSQQALLIPTVTQSPPGRAPPHS